MSDCRRAERSPLESRINPIRVALLGRTPLFCETLAAALEREPVIHLAARIDGWGESSALEHLAVDQLIIESSPPVAQACEAIRTCSRTRPEVDVLAIAIASESDVVNLLAAGARSYLFVHESLGELMSAMRSLACSEARCDPKITASVAARIRALRRSREPAGSLRELTPREEEVLYLVAEGLANKEIARRCGITLPTVKNHVHHILAKLEVDSRRAAARVVFSNGAWPGEARRGLAGRRTVTQ